MTGGAAAREEGYLLPNAEEAAGARLAPLSALFDEVTFRHLSRVGIAPGWRCWEVGAGGPGVPRWMADRVAPGGRVVATDIDVSRLSPAPPGVEVIRHDVGTDRPPAGPFDLVHARLVLTHVPSRRQALTAMVEAVRPGGWVVVEDADPGLQPLACPDERGPDEARANRLRAGFRRLLADRGADLAFGRTLPRLLRDAGLTEVGAEASFPLAAPASVALELATLAQVRDALVGAGLATDEEVDGHRRAVEEGRLDLATAPLVSAWGRRPDG